METSTFSIADRLVNWFQRSITVKLVSIGILALILLLPSSWVQDLMQERQSRAETVVNEISQKWSVAQTIAGPILVIPYTYTEKIENAQQGATFVQRNARAFFLPEELSVNGSVAPQTLHRGIFDAVVYDASLNLDARFAKPDLSDWNIDPAAIRWKDAYLAIGISDLRGIHDNPTIKLGDSLMDSEPSADLGVTFNSYSSLPGIDTNSYGNAEEHGTRTSQGIIAHLNGMTPDHFEGDVSMTLQLKGSERLYFSPVGKTTAASINGPWNDPSFDGAFLPQSREITKEGFSANWKVLQFNRAFEGHWIEAGKSLGDADFGLTFLVPVDQYQKSIRTSKYSALIILLTFVALLLVEVAYKTRIHPFQYTLIGAALIVYYTLLLSLAEQVGYNISYWISSLATTVLIAAYSRTFFKKKMLTALLTTLLTVFYLFIFVIVIQQDFSLLLGSLGLFLVISLLMYFSRKINWYHAETEING